MKVKVFPALLIGVFILLLSGCSRPDTTESDPTSSQTSVLPTGTTLVSPTPVPSATLLPSPGSTSPPEATATEFPTLPPAVLPCSITPRPTFTPEEREAYWLDLIATNKGCELPCWWGITPGVTRIEELGMLYVPDGREYPCKISLAGDLLEFPIHINQDEVLNFTLSMRVKDAIVQRISIVADNLDDFNELSVAMSRYSLGKVLTQYGVPTEIYLAMFAGPHEKNAPWEYDLWLYYEPSGILIGYTGEGISREGEMNQVCPLYEKVKLIRLELEGTSLESRVPIKELMGYTDFYPPLSLGQATNLNIAEFYELFVDEEVENCFDTPREVWR